MTDTVGYEAQPDGRPETALVVGAGVVGLSAAWFLQQHDVQVTVVDADVVGAGASWGNAGYVTHGLVSPLPEPSALRYGLRALFDPRSPVRFGSSATALTARFLLGFVRYASSRHWTEGVRALIALSSAAQEAFDELISGGVDVDIHASPLLAAFLHAAEEEAFVHELNKLAALGQDLPFDRLNGDDARSEEPLLSAGIEAAVKIHGQRFLDPARLVRALSTAVEERGGTIMTGTPVAGLRLGRRDRVDASTPAGPVVADVAVIAAGAWTPRLARPHGVRIPMQAGRGYSFTVEAGRPLRQPTYFPAARSATVPTPTGLRITGLMDLESPAAPPRHERLDVIRQALMSGLSSIDWSTTANEWVGSRPLTADGLPVIGQTVTPGVFVAAGHGMWGLTLGPVTGKMLALQIVSRARPTVLRPFDPCR